MPRLRPCLFSGRLEGGLTERARRPLLLYGLIVAATIALAAAALVMAAAIVKLARVDAVAIRDRVETNLRDAVGQQA